MLDSLSRTNTIRGEAVIPSRVRAAHGRLQPEIAQDFVRTSSDRVLPHYFLIARLSMEVFAREAFWNLLQVGAQRVRR